MALPEDRRESADLLTFLDAQRRSVAAIVEGLQPDEIHQSVVPSRWTPVSLLEHLAQAEYLWFERVVAGPSGFSDRSSVEPDTPGVADGNDLEAVLDVYRDQCGRSDSIVAATGLDSRPAGEVPADMTDEIHDVRTIVLHMIEETARHAGHLDIARELIDGRTGLGPR